LSDAKLRAAKKQLMGQIRIAGDNLESYALALGKTYARTGKHRDVDLICDRIASVLAQDLLQVAQDIFDPRQLSSLVYL
jgi:predicted Zn-dependent peptidase